jgi:hypothetical protein
LGTLVRRTLRCTVKSLGRSRHGCGYFVAAGTKDTTHLKGRKAVAGLRQPATALDMGMIRSPQAK